MENFPLYFNYFIFKKLFIFNFYGLFLINNNENIYYI
jgi:hypothetical protein